MKSRINIFAEIDWFTIALYFVLVFLGWINIYAAVYNFDNDNIFDFSQRYGKQLIWIGLALFVIIIIFIIDAKFYNTFAYIIYGLIVIMLLAVLVLGRKVNGAVSWFEIAGFRIQPAEFAKFATNLAIAKYLSSFNFKIYRLKSLFTITLILFLPAALILFQNDTGSAMVYVVFILVLYREGLSGSILLIAVLTVILFILALIYNLTSISIILIIVSLIIYTLSRRNWKESLFASLVYLVVASALFGINYFLKFDLPLYLILLFAIIISGLFFLFYAYRFRIRSAYLITLFLIASIAYVSSVDYVFNNVLEPHQQNRIKVVLGLLSDPHGVGYNVTQSKIAIGSGGLAGKGFLQGTQTKFDFVPEQTTDFIFCTVGEEWGFIGTSVVVLLFMTLLLRLIYLAERQRSNFNRIFGWGVMSIIFFHFAVNIAMTIGLAPVIGIPLPFFSYGGSSLWGFTILLFVFLKLDSSRKTYL